MKKFTVFYRNNFDFRWDVPKSVKQSEYTEVGTVEAENLGHLFRIMNVVDDSDFEMPQKLKCRSMSFGDIAVDEHGTAHYCTSVGWEITKFEEG